MSWLQQLTSSSADLLMTPAGCGTSICCRVHQFPFLALFWRDTGVEKQECVSSCTRERQRGNRRTEITRWKRRRKNKTGVDELGGKRRRGEKLKFWNILSILPLLLCSPPPLSEFLSVSRTHPLLHCRWTPEPNRKRDEQRETRKTELASDYSCSIPTKTSKCVYTCVIPLYFLSLFNLIYCWTRKGVMSARPPRRLSSALSAQRTWCGCTSLNLWPYDLVSGCLYAAWILNATQRHACRVFLYTPTTTTHLST